MGVGYFLWNRHSIWMNEAIDGARAFHLYFPLPKLRFYSPPIKEEWIQQLDIDNL